MAKRLMCIILSVLMIVSLLPTGAFATEATDDGTSIVEDAGSTGNENDESIGEEETEANADASGDEQAEEVAEDLVEETSEPVAAANEGEEEETQTSTTNVAKIGETEYASLSAAIAAIESTGTITLTANVTEDVVIPSGKTITLELENYNVTNASGHTITNYGTLTITGSGTVDNTAHAKGAVVNYGTAYLYGGKYTRSAEKGASSTDNGGNSWYTIKNYNAMVIGDATSAAGTVEVSNTGCYSSCIANGYQNASDKSSALTVNSLLNPTLTINASASVSGGIATIKNDDEATLTINGGTFTNTNGMVVQNHSAATISGGTFAGSTYAVYNCGCDEDSDKGTLTISGGTFTGVYALADVSTAATATVSVSDGSFIGTSAAIGTSSNSTAAITVSGGTYLVSTTADDGTATTTADTSVEAYLASNVVIDEATGLVSNGTIVAKIGNTEYASLARAIAAVTDNTETTITLVANATESSGLTVSESQNIILDLGTYTLDMAGTYIDVFGSLTIQGSGTITTSRAGEAVIYANGSSAKVTLSSGNIKNTGSQGYGIASWYGGTTIVNGGTIASESAALAGNGLCGNCNFEVNGGTLTTTYGAAIYMPGQGTLNITGGTINGGISLRMGQVTISGGTINATTGDIDSITQYYGYSGNVWLADAIYVFGGTYASTDEANGNSLSLKITGGTINCTNDQGNAVTIYNLDKTAQTATVEISGGSLNGGDGYAVVNFEDLGVENSSYGTGTNSVSTAISGGTFSGDVSAYCTDGYAAVYDSEDGTYSVKTGVAAVYVDGVCTGVYDTLTAAYNATPANGTLKLLSTINAPDSGNTLSVYKTMTLDLNGHTLNGGSGIAIYVSASGITLTITDSSSDGDGTVSGTGGSGLVRVMSGAVVIDGGTYTSSGNVLKTSGSDASIIVKSGTFTSTGSNTISNAGGSITINGGTFTAGGDAPVIGLATGATSVTITGGTFESSVSYNYEHVGSEDSTGFEGVIRISGGKFKATTTWLIESYLADGYAVISSTDEGYYEVSIQSAVLFYTSDGKTVTKGYSSVQAAINAIAGLSSASDITVTMYSDYSSRVYVTSGEFTLDLNGYTITTNEDDGIALLISGGTVTITDGSEAQTGTVTTCASNSNTSALVRVTGGTVTLAGGNYWSASGQGITYVTGGTLTISGGNFTSAPSSDFLASGYAVFGTTDETYLYTVASADTAVAKIDSVYYTSLSSAISSAASGETVTVLSDIVLTSGITVGDNKSITLDLNNCKVSRVSKDDGYVESYLIYVESGASLTVDDSSDSKGGKLSSTYVGSDGTYITGYAVSTEGTLTVNAGTLSGYYGVYVSGSSAELNVSGGTVYGSQIGILDNGGKVNISGGSVTGSSHSGVYVDNGGTVEISGGSISSKYAVNVQSGSATVSDGTISGSSYGINLSSGSVTVSGGTVSGARAIYGNAGTLTVSGGTVTGTQMGLSIGGTLTVYVKDDAVITNSESSSSTWAMYLWQDSYTGTTTISGGTIGGEYTDFCITACGGKVDITGGAITAASVALVATGSDTTVTLSGENTKLTGDYGAEVLSGASLNMSDGTIEATTVGVYLQKGTLNVSGGTIKADTYGISTNGTNNSSYYPNTITISGGTIEADYGMYLPAVQSTTTITGGEIIGATTGIEIRAGSLTVSGDSTVIKSTCETFSTQANGSGTTVVGAGIAISQHTTDQPVTVTITGGTISGYYGVYELNTNASKNSEEVNVLSVTTEGSSSSATIIATSGNGKAIYSESVSDGTYAYTTVSISAGSFSTIVDDNYCADGYVPVTEKNNQGYYAVKIGSTVAKINNDEYVSLYQAVKNAEDGDTICLTANISLASNLYVTTEGTITIDLSGNDISIASDVTLNVSEDSVVVISDSQASTDGGLVTNNGVIAVEGTLDIRDLGYTTETSGSGLLGHEDGKITLGASSTFIVLDVWNDMWSSLGTWSPNWTSATGTNGIISSAAEGAKIYSYGVGYVCDADVTSDTYESSTTYWKLSGTYLVEYYKGWTETTDNPWKYPELPSTENKIFAGWYDADGEVYSATSGEAYAKFVTLVGENGSAAGVINFLGAGLSTAYNDDSSDYSTIAIRFGYDIVIPTGCDGENNYSWAWLYSVDNNTYYTATGTNSTTDLGGAYTSTEGTTKFRSNFVLKNIPSFAYDTNIYSILKVTYKTADGTKVTATDSTTRSSSVSYVVTKIGEIYSSGASDYEKAIYDGIQALSNAGN